VTGSCQDDNDMTHKNREYAVRRYLHGAEAFKNEHLLSHSRNSKHSTEPEGSLPHAAGNQVTSFCYKLMLKSCRPNALQLEVSLDECTIKTRMYTEQNSPLH
jgi:hypothetical protein